MSSCRPITVQNFQHEPVLLNRPLETSGIVWPIGKGSNDMGRRLIMEANFGQRRLYA